MDHADHVRLLKPGVAISDGVWADVGSGSGAFTLALAELLDRGAVLHSIDRDRAALRRQKRRLEARFPEMTVRFYHHDYTQRLDLPALDGLVMANSLHFQRHKEPVVELLRSYLKPGGRFILVEYNTDHGNRWVPHPISYDTWEVLARKCGFVRTDLLARAPSSFLGEFYSAMSVNGRQEPGGERRPSASRRAHDR